VQPTDFEAILKTLAGNHVDLVVVGGVAATLQGAPITTFDLDIVHSREEANLDRLMAALRELDAWYREKPDVRIAPDRERLGGPGHHLLMTRAGPLDVLGVVVTGEGYTELAAHSDLFDLGDNVEIRVLDLPTIIAIKERLNRETDRAVLPLLRRTLNEKP
jgi:hypothetical protein